jgi:hypothetical protein
MIHQNKGTEQLRVESLRRKDGADQKSITNPVFLPRRNNFGNTL